MKKYVATSSAYTVPSDGSTVYPLTLDLVAGTYEVWVGLDSPNGGLVAGAVDNADAVVFPLEPLITSIPNTSNAGLCSKGIYKLTSDGSLKLALNTYGGSSVVLNHVAMSAVAVTT